MAFSTTTRASWRFNSAVCRSGKRCNHLRVVGPAPRPDGAKHHRLMWECLCDCGTTTVVVGKQLRSGMTKSCGCLRTESTIKSRRKAPGESGYNELWHSYRIGAKKRGLDFALDRVQFRVLTDSSCHYCGAAPSGRRWMRCRGSTPAGVLHSTYTHSGVDRVDSSVGYIVSNCVPCCTTCNLAKRSMSVEAFIGWARRIVAHQDLKIEK